MPFASDQNQAAARIIWDYMRLGHALKKADAIVVPGCYDPDCATYAAELYLQGLAPVIVMSGGVKPLWREPKWQGMNEAEVFASVAIEKGVPESDVIIEDRATNTSENLWFAEELLQQRGIDAKTVILVQKPSFERRLYATARHRWPDKDVIVTSRPVAMQDYIGVMVDVHDGLSSLIGDFQRLETYRGLHLADETIPAECWPAFATLAECGYTKRLCEPVEKTLARVGMAQASQSEAVS